MKENYKNIIGTDWTGWPIYKLSIKDILIQLGASTVDGRIGFDENNCILDVYPTRLTDNGMGYGVDEQYITDVDVFQCENEESMIHIWTEPQHSQEEVDNIIKDLTLIEQANKN